jgi:hypothetical protein
MKRYCQMRIIGDGIRLDQQPPASDSCNKPAHHRIVVWGRRQWVSPRHYAEQMQTRGILQMDGERLDPNKDANY